MASGGWRDGEPAREFNGLFCRVAGKRGGVLDDPGRAGKIVQRAKPKSSTEDGADFTHFVGVARGKEQRNHVRTITGGN